MSDFQPVLPTMWDPNEISTSKVENFTPPGPLYPNLPSATRSFNRKYSTNNIYEQNLRPDVYTALKNYDQLRVAQGKSPISRPKTVKMAEAAQANRAITPEPEKNLLEAGVSDLSTLVQSLPRLPGQLITEAKNLTSIPEQMAKIQAERQGPGEQLAGYLQLPGVNLIPGTYTAANVLGGHSDELLKHPLFTALDVLPYANKAAKATPVAKAAHEAQLAEATSRAELTGLPRGIPHQNAIKDVLTKKLVDGEVQPNAIGQTWNATKNVLGETKPGQFIQDTWSPQAREAARIESMASKDLRNRLNPAGPATNNPIDLYMRQVNSIRQRFPDIDDATSESISKRLTNPVNDAGNPIAIKDMGFSGPQLAYAMELKDLADKSSILAELDNGLNPDFELASREWNGSDELFTRNQAKGIDRVQTQLDKYRQRTNSREVAYNYLRDTFDRSNNSPTQIIAGVEVSNPTAAIELNNIIDKMKGYRRRANSPLNADAKMFLNHITRKRFTEAQSLLNRMSKTRRWSEALDSGEVQAALGTLDNVKEMAGVYEKYKHYTPSRLAQREATVQRIINRKVPARFGEIEQGLAKEVAKEKVRQINADNPLLDSYLSHVDNGNYASLIDEGALTSKEYISIQKEVRDQIAELKLQGADPVFLHRTDPSGAKATLFPRVTDKKFTPSSLKDRTLDTSPYVEDLSVALSHQGMEFLGRQAAEQYVSTIDRAYGRDLSSLRAEYLPRAQEAKLTNPRLNVNAYIDAAMKRDGWVKFDAESVIPWKKKTGGVLEANNARMIPATVARNIERVQNPPKLIAAIDPAMNAFRTSVLALSPRWLVNNMFGGAIMTLLETADPIRTLKFLGEARRMTSSGKIHEIPGMSEGAFDIAPEEVAKVVNAMTDAEKLSAIHQYSAGKWIRNVWDQAQVQKARSGLGKVIAKSYDLNQWGDDFYRSLAYLTGEDKALMKGLTAHEAEMSGIATARKIMQNWDEITPIERTVLRYVFPFYGFMQHITRYVMRYPFDHPWRTAVLGSFARNELNDMGTGLPQRFLSMITLGEPDENGNQKALTFGAANPFANIANMWTLGGMIGASNPLISSFAESLGIDPTTGASELYPNMRYNSETGRLEPEQKNYAATLLGNLVPWYNTANDVIFDNARFTQLLKTNPDAAARQLQAQTGMPILFRTVNPNQEIMKAELNRIEAQDKAKSEMLRTGNYEIADKYPGLQGYLRMLQEKGDELKKYQEPAMAPNPVRALVDSYTGQANLPPINFQSR